MEVSRTLRVLLIEPDDERFASVAEIARRVPGGGIELSRVTCPDDAADRLSAADLDFVLAPSRLGEDEAGAAAALIQQRGLLLPVVALVDDDPSEAGLEALRSEGATEFLDRSRLTPEALHEAILRAEARSLVHQALVRDRSLLDTLLDETDLIAVVLDASGHVLRLNWAAQQVLGLDPKDTLGEPFVGLARGADAGGLAETLEHALHGDGPFYAERSWQTPRGLRRSLAWTISALPGAAEAPAAILCTALDRTPQRRAGQQIRFQSALIENLAAATDSIGLAVDPDGVILVTDGEAGHLAHTDLLGQVVYSALSDYPDALALVRRATEGEGGSTTLDWDGQSAKVCCEPIWWGAQLAGATLTITPEAHPSAVYGESTLGAVLDCLGVPTALVGVDGSLSHLNAAWRGITATEAPPPAAFAELFRDPAELAEAFQEARVSGAWSGPVHIVSDPDRERTLHLCAARTDKGAWVGVTATLI